MKKISTRGGFTIVELLVVVVVIGILAAITIISYSGVQKKATASTLSAELSSAVRRIKLFQIDNDELPSSIDDCPNPTGENLCLKTVDDVSFAYSVDNAVSTKKFVLTATKGNLKYFITEDSEPKEYTQVTATGGTIADIGGFRIHTFTNGGTFNVTNGGYIEYLIVAGGGGGQTNVGNPTSTGGGGGGAGGYLMGIEEVSIANYPVVVGSGGTNAGDATAQGGDSSVFSKTAIGGGRSGSRWLPAVGGGSGGGSGYTDYATPGLGVAGQGFSGGASVGAYNFGGGGGGGAMGPGQSGSTVSGGSGGVGFNSSISGTSVGYCGGGGGAIGGSVAGNEGLATHGGGDGGSGVKSGSDAQPNTGGGGGGAPSTNYSTGISGSGGSGIVIIRYAI